tara:strand:+ start:3878 stop:4909 length:1032 start_codon:yes stop_codon:yes gene_type:complete
MFILEFFYDLITYQSPGMEGVSYASWPAVIAAGLQLIGQSKAKKDARRRERDAQALREDAFDRLGANREVPQALLDQMQQSKALVEQAADQAREAQETGFTRALSQARNMDPRAAAGVLPRAVNQLGLSEQQRGLQTAQQILQSQAPVLADKMATRDIYGNIAQADIVGADAAYQAAGESKRAAQAAMYNMPMDMYTAYLAGGSEGDFLGIPTKNKKIPTGDGTGKKEGGYISNKAMGGTIAQLLSEGDSFTTPGPEDHDKQEFDIVDSESGEIVARSTGGEKHTVEEGGAITVTNGEQEDSMLKAFSEVANSDNPTDEELKKVYEAVYGVYSKPQFQAESIA